jgi:2-polyprenyl-3-methyl-5-hydroxy-6-metoxy-1,4-benzoquinol methylase
MNFEIVNIGISFLIKLVMKLSNGLLKFLIYIKYEWYSYFRYSDFLDLANVLFKYIKSRDEVLIIGCGNSTLSSDLYDTGIEHITNIDLSDKAIKQMKKQNEKQRSHMKWLQMDARQVC